jgi:hypothetical protein
MTFVPTPVVRALAGLTLLVVGIFIGMLISHRVISAQVTHYGNTQMAGGSVLINVLDDIAPYLASTLVGGMVLLPLTLAAWTWSRPMPRGLRIAAVVLFAGLIILGAVVLGLGGRAPASTTQPHTAPLPVSEYIRGRLHPFLLRFSAVQET